MNIRSSGAGTIYKYRDGYRAGFCDPSGKRIYKNFKTSQAASDWLSEMRTDVRRGTYIQETAIPLGEWLIDYLDTYKKPKVRVSTLARYYSTVKLMSPLLNIPLKELSSYALQRFYNSLPENLSYSSKSKVYKLLNAALRKAAVLGMMKDITQSLELPKAKKQSEIEIYTIDELKRIFDYLKDNAYYKRYYLFVKLAVATDARLGELLALRVENVHENYIEIDSSAHATNGKMYITPPKTKSGNRRVTISPDLSQALKDYADGYVYVFHTAEGNPWNTHTIDHAWDKILTNSGVPHKHFHALRHTHATQLLANNVPLLEVSKRLGHAQPSVTLDMYGHAIKGYDTTIPNKINNIFPF